MAVRFNHPEEEKRDLTLILKRFFRLDKTNLIIFLVFSFIALMFFASPLAFAILAIPIGGLYYFILLYTIQGLTQLFGITTYFPSLGEPFFSVVLATTVIGYLYLLSSYISYIVRRKKVDPKGVIMFASVVAIFTSPFLLSTYQSVVNAQNFEHMFYNIVDESTCNELPVSGSGTNSWDEQTRTCSMNGVYVTNAAILGIAEDVTLEILPLGNLTVLGGVINNNGTILVNGGTMNNMEGNVLNAGLIHNKNGTVINDGNIETDTYFDGYEVRQSFSIGTLLNEATFDNRSHLSNHGNFTNFGSLTNSGEVQFFGGSVIVNNGTIVNNGRMEIAGELNNYDLIQNSGTFVIYRQLQFSPIDSAKITMVNNYGDMVNSVGEINNNGIITNYGTITNMLGQFVNLMDAFEGVIINHGTIANDGGTFTNDGVLNNECNGIVTGDLLGNAPLADC